MKTIAKQQLRRLRFLRFGLLCCGIFSVSLLIYASLVPLNYQPLSWAETNRRWRDVPWLELGLYQRADWVANALVVIPGGFFLAGFLSLNVRSRFLLTGLLIVLALSLGGLVTGIEYIQIWFPPRTVSQNDIWAGWIGAWLGPLFWFLFGRQAVWLGLQFLQRPTIADRLSCLCIGVFLASVIYSVMPLDLILSKAELMEKWYVGRLSIGLGWPTGSKLGFLKGLLLAGARLFPLGVYLGLRSCPAKWAWITVALAAIGLELIQIPIFTKYATVWEIVAGFVAGICGLSLGRGPRWLQQALLNPLIWGGGTVVLLFLIPTAFLARFETIATDPQILAERWDGLWTGFLIRYYYTSEYRALSNLAGKLIIFGGLGFFMAGWNWSAHQAKKRGSKFYVSLYRTFGMGLMLSFAVGLGIEIGQIYLLPLIADLTDVATYVCGYCVGFAAGWALLWGVKPRID